MDHELIAGIDAGGTSFKCLIARRDGSIVAEHRVPTSAPEETVDASVETLRALIPEGSHISSLGVAAFGPLDLAIGSATFGSILDTPKPGWSNFNLKAAFEQKLPGWKVSIDLDVNAALSAEIAWGAASGLHSCAYVTVGTGIGVGLMINNQRIDQVGHPEVGHIPIARAPFELEDFRSICSFHSDCLEGYTSAPALIKRFEGSPEDWPDSHPAWRLVAFYLAQLCRSLTYTVGPQKIMLGGGVMNKAGLRALIRKSFASSVAGYCVGNIGRLDQYIVRPGLGAKSGERGALYLALCDD